MQRNVHRLFTSPMLLLLTSSDLCDRFTDRLLLWAGLRRMRSFLARGQGSELSEDR